MERMKHTGDYELDEINMLKQECADLEEENKTLKEKLSEITMVADDEKQSIEHILELEEENKKLKSDLAYERTMLDNVRAEYKSLQNINKNLKDRIDELEKCNLNLQERLDRKEELNKSYRKEIKEHKLYEEKLEHRIIEFEELLHGE